MNLAVGLDVDANAKEASHRHGRDDDVDKVELRRNRRWAVLTARGRKAGGRGGRASTMCPHALRSMSSRAWRR